MAGGKRIGAGRKPHLEDKTAEMIVRMSAATILHALRSKELDIEKRSEIARHFVLKAMPTVVDINKTEEIYQAIDINIEGLESADLKSLISQGRTSFIPERTA